MEYDPRASAAGPTLAERWRDIQGLNHWSGMLEPLDIELRKTIIRCGEFNQAIYDAFDSEVHSKYVGSSKYRKEELFEKVHLETAEKKEWGYEVSRYLYATATSHILGRFFLSSRSKEAWSKESNWIGYVAVATDEGKKWLGRRDIVIVWRGTLRLFEWIDDFHAQKSDAADFLPPEHNDNEAEWYESLQKMSGGANRELFNFRKEEAADHLKLPNEETPESDMAADLDVQEGETKESRCHWYDWLLGRKRWAEASAKPKIEKGWLLVYTSRDSKSPYTEQSAREQVLDELRYLLEKYKDEEVSITVVGHSLGASLAVVNAYDIAENGLNVRKGGKEEAVLVTAVVFGCPLVGDAAFKKRCEELQGLRILRVKNKRDLIALYPPTFLGYCEVGQELLVDHRTSPFLSDSKTIGDWHNLEAHLHLVAGTHGPDKPFQLAIPRDPALVNKSCNFLREDLHIPGSWWQDQFKGLLRHPITGAWHLPDRHSVHVPQPELPRSR